MVEQESKQITCPTESGAELPATIKGGSITGTTYYSSIEEGKDHGRYADVNADKGDMSDIIKPLQMEYNDARKMEGGA
jgi:hypothetical protein